MPDMAAAPKKILIVDDDRGLCNMMALILRGGGYQTITAFSGESGLELFRAEHPDLVLLDVAMPGLNGFEVAAKMRRIENDTGHAQIVIITAYAQSFLVSIEFNSGIDSYLTKPILPHELLAHVRNILEA